jgi:hypothetical protein
MGLAILRLAAVIAVLFGAATVASGGNVLFGSGAPAAGNYVPFIVWFNFVAGFAYMAVAAGLWLRAGWAVWAAAALALLTGFAFAALGGYIAAGSAYEPRTVAAMVLRLALWCLIAVLAIAGTAKRRVSL